MNRRTRDLLRHAMERARGSPEFLAAALAEYQEMHGMDDTTLAAWLGCDPERLPRLALCLMPEDAPATFREGIDQITRSIGLDGQRLTRLVREVQSVRALRGDADQDTAPGLLMAARDRETTGADTPADGEDEDAPPP